MQESICPKNIFPNHPVIDKDAFEISFMNPVGAAPGDAVRLWRASPGHSAPMLTQGPWSSLGRVGCWYHAKWANCWFSQ